MLRRTLLVGLLASLVAGSALAIELTPEQVPEVKRTQAGMYLTPQEAYDFATTESASTLFVDVRTPAELQFVGLTAIMDANVPFITYDYSVWDDKVKEYKRVRNTAFLAEIEAALAQKGLSGQKDARIVVMCRSGDRSAKASDLLNKAGYTNVWSQLEGFEGDKAKDGAQKGQRVVNGWKNANLPWTYDLSKEKAYFIQ